jgi:hypothetical protein
VTWSLDRPSVQRLHQPGSERVPMAGYLDPEGPTERGPVAHAQDRSQADPQLVKVAQQRAVAVTDALDEEPGARRSGV